MTFLAWLAASWLLPLGVAARPEGVAEVGGALAAAAVSLLAVRRRAPLSARGQGPVVAALRLAVASLAVTACYGAAGVVLLSPACYPGCRGCAGLEPCCSAASWPRTWRCWLRTCDAAGIGLAASLAASAICSVGSCGSLCTSRQSWSRQLLARVSARRTATATASA
ncbi:MAG TPA: hypothetical protein VFQ68_15065 [Streptosporangiaceae bacterium]|nr:hypothetical protein [Streptosporangiaceae bacterium]